MFRKILRRIGARRSEEERAIDDLLAVGVGKGDVVIDCGANVGKITAVLARTGATVYCFEPNPDAFRVLEDRFSSHVNVHCFNKAVSDHDGEMRLYLHEHAGEDPVYWSTGSSLLDFKSNISKDDHVTVEVVDLSRFMKSLGRNIRLIKMDVEGAECAILRHIIETGAIDLVDHMFVETHDHKIPELKEETDALRALIREKGLDSVIKLDWV